MKTAVQNRQWDIDCLKTIAIIGVVLIHVSRAGYYFCVPEFDWFSSVLWGSITRGSVPVFLMCSGALMLVPQKELSWKRLYLHNLPRLIIAMFAWAFFYEIVNGMLSRTLTWPNLWQSVKDVLLFRHEFHLYYLHIIILVYVFLPITRIFVRYADRRTLEYALAVWFLLGIFYVTVRPYWPFNLLSGIPVQWMLNLTYASIGYGIWGYYLRTYPLPRWCGAAMTVGGVALVYGGTCIASLTTGNMVYTFMEGTNVGAFLLASGCYILIVTKAKTPSDFWKNIFAWLSKASFCIYLVHVAVIYLLNNWGITIDFAPYLVSVPLLALLNLIISSVVYLLLSKIPVVNRWLI